jgi:hypothetical protein
VISLNVKESLVTRAARKVIGQLRFNHFNWMTIHPVYQNDRCEIPIQNNVDFYFIIVATLNLKKIAVLKTPGRCAQPRVKMLQIFEGVF